MASLTQLDDTDIAAIAAAFTMGGVRAWHPVAAGTINSNFAVRTDRGRFFVRVNEGKSEADVQYEAALCRALAVRQVPLVCPLQASAGADFLAHRGHLVSAFPWVEGSHRERREVSAQDAEHLGAALAKLHLAGAEILADFDSPGIYTFAALVSRFEGFRASADPALAPAIALLGDEIAWQRARDFSAAARSIIHGDLFRDNVLFAGDRIAALIDFEQASAGLCAYDLAVCINAWCYDEEFSPALIAALARGYERLRPLGDDKQHLYALTRRAAMRFAITRITDVYLAGQPQPAGTGAPSTGATGATRGKDFRRYLARLHKLRAAGAGAFDAWLGPLQD